jgi:hypothetical protein
MAIRKTNANNMRSRSTFQFFELDNTLDIARLPRTPRIAAGSLARVLETGDVLEFKTSRSWEKLGTTGGGTPITTNEFSQAFSNATFSGGINSIEVRLNGTTSMVSFWGFVNQDTAGVVGASNVMLSPDNYPLLTRFIGQVDQFAMGYNSNIGSFSYLPIRITADQGFELVTAPNIAIGTRFSFQFVLVLTYTGVISTMENVGFEIKGD